MDTHLTSYDCPNCRKEWQIEAELDKRDGRVLDLFLESGNDLPETCGCGEPMDRAQIEANVWGSYYGD
jgi:hypothetical protein